MKYAILFLGCFLFFSAPSEALLPPLYESIAEIKSIVNNEQLGQKLTAGEFITTIQKNDQGYEITTNQHRLQVDVTTATSHDGKVGPRKFDLKFHEALPLTTSTNASKY